MLEEIRDKIMTRPDHLLQADIDAQRASMGLAEQTDPTFVLCRYCGNYVRPESECWNVSMSRTCKTATNQSAAAQVPSSARAGGELAEQTASHSTLAAGLTWWAISVRATLFPLDFFYWRMSKSRGYQTDTDTWLIEGVAYSGAALRWLAKAQGEIYRVTRTGETVTLESIDAELYERIGYEK